MLEARGITMYSEAELESRCATAEASREKTESSITSTRYYNLLHTDAEENPQPVAILQQILTANTNKMDFLTFCF